MVYLPTFTSFFEVTWIDSPNGGHVYKPRKGHKNGSKRGHFEAAGTFS